MESLARAPHMPAHSAFASLPDETTTALMQSGLVAFLVVEAGNIIASSPTLREMLGATTPYQHLDGSNLLSIVCEPHRQSVREYCSQLLQGGTPARLQCQLLDATGGALSVQLAGRAVTLEAAPQIVLVVTDLSEWVGGPGAAASQQLNAFDPVTGFPNRALLVDRMRIAVSAARRYRRRAALLRIELENLEPVLATLGTDAGLEVQAAIAETLRNGVRDCDTVARLGTQQFAILLPEIGQREDAGISAARVVEAISVLFGRNEASRRVRAAIGVAVFPTDGTNAERLLAAAETSLAGARGTADGAFALADATTAELASIQTLEFRTEFLVGNTQIDDEHRAIVRHVNTLIRDLKAGASVSQLEAQVRAIAEQLREHFAEEARLQGSSPYESAVDLKTRNLRFLDELQCILVHATPHSMALAVRHLYDWLVPHLMSLDAKMAS